MGDLQTLETIVVVRRTGIDVPDDRRAATVFYDEMLEAADPECPPEPLDAEHPLFILYTSGSTAKPKGILHTTGGYLTGVTATHRYVFDLKPESDVYWCAADVGWVTGHSYIVYGPLANGVTSVMWEGAPDYPHKGVWWEIVARYGATILYAAPTAIRTFIKWGAEIPGEHDLSSLRLLGSVGEPINPKAWLWYHKVIGGERCPIVDTWWQTETGAIMITPLPGITATKPGSATQPLPGRRRRGGRRERRRADRDGQGLLVLTRPWPSMLRTLYKEEDRFVETYFERFGKETYLVGDAARRDEDGYFWVIGRIDDVVNVSGHRLSTAEVESAIVAHEKVAEAAVIGQSDEDTGQAICAFVTLAAATPSRSDELVEGIRAHGRRADRQIRPPEADHLGRRPAQDPLRQDHAPPAARHRRGPRAGRRHHAARPRRDGGAGGEDRRGARRRGLARRVFNPSGNNSPHRLLGEHGTQGGDDVVCFFGYLKVGEPNDLISDGAQAEVAFPILFEGDSISVKLVSVRFNDHLRGAPDEVQLHSVYLDVVLRRRKTMSLAEPQEAALQIAASPVQSNCRAQRQFHDRRLPERATHLLGTCASAARSCAP